MGGPADMALSFLGLRAKENFISFANTYKVKTKWLLSETAVSIFETREFTHEFSKEDE